MRKQTIITLTALTILLAVGAFYWWQWRPMQIREKCSEIAFEHVVKSEEASAFLRASDASERIYRFFNESCLDGHGLK